MGASTAWAAPSKPECMSIARGLPVAAAVDRAPGDPSRQRWRAHRRHLRLPRCRRPAVRPRARRAPANLLSVRPDRSGAALGRVQPRPMCSRRPAAEDDDSHISSRASRRSFSLPRCCASTSRPPPPPTGAGWRRCVIPCSHPPSPSCTGPPSESGPSPISPLRRTSPDRCSTNDSVTRFAAHRSAISPSGVSMWPRTASSPSSSLGVAAIGARVG